ncbi:MAG: hypothetical protein ACJ76I_15170 [Gaiellaceae bacterium]
MKAAALFAAAFVVAGCGAQKPSAHERANSALLDRLPVYPGSAAPKTAPGDAFAVRDWRLPAGAAPSRVVDWYVSELQARGWRISGKSFATIRASRDGSSVSIGVRMRTLEVVANA